MCAAFGVGVFVFHVEPEVSGNLRAVEECADEGDHVVLRLRNSFALGYVVTRRECLWWWPQ